jgi:hypothetical protein
MKNIFAGCGSRKQGNFMRLRLKTESLPLAK